MAVERAFVSRAKHNLLPARQIPIDVALSGGVTATAITTPAVGVLLRLSVACFVGVPLEQVVIASIDTNASTAVENLAVAAVAPVNVAAGDQCASVQGQQGGRAMTDSTAVALLPLPARLRFRRIATADVASIVVHLAVYAAACSDASGSSPSLPPAVLAQLSAFNRTVSAGGPAYTSFVAAAADVSGVPAHAVFAQGAVTGLGSSVSPSPTPAQGSPSAASGVSRAVIAGGATVGALFAVALLVVIALHLRRQRVLAESKANGVTNAERPADVEFSGENPLHFSSRHVRAAVLAERCVVGPPSPALKQRGSIRAPERGVYDASLPWAAGQAPEATAVRAGDPTDEQDRTLHENPLRGEKADRAEGRGVPAAGTALTGEAVLQQSAATYASAGRAARKTPLQGGSLRGASR